MADEIVFKCEPAMWGMMNEEGVTGIPFKPFDMRRHDLADDRIYRLSFMTWVGAEPGEPDLHFEQQPHLAHPTQFYKPDEETITFLNTETRETVTRSYLGMEFTAWAPGWCFLIVGQRVG